MSAAAAAQGALDLQAGKMFQLAAFTMLLYDHLITLSDEVERVWKRPWTLATWLFAFNRYLNPLEFGVIIPAFFSPAWTRDRSACTHFVRFEGGGTLVLVSVCEIVMILRVYALFGRNNTILAILTLLWCAQVTLGGIALANSQVVDLPPGLVGCILTGSGPLWTPFWAAPLVTDATIFILTIWRTRQSIIVQTSNNQVRYILRRDGVLYFLCIFSANLLNTTLFLTAREDLKAIGASFSQLITSVMISRLVLNLRGLAGPSNQIFAATSQYSTTDFLTERHVVGRTSSNVGTISTYIIGNLGEELEDERGYESEGESVDVKPGTIFTSGPINGQVELNVLRSLR